MKFISHNFSQNWANASGSDDQEMQKDIIISEVEKIIADQPADFITVANSSGVKLAPDATVTNMVDAFLDNLDNTRFQKELAILILSTNKVNLNANGDERQSGSGTLGSLFGGSSTTTQGGADPVSAVSNAIGAIAGIFKSRQEGKNIKAQTRNEMLASLNQGSQQSTAMKSALWIGGILLVGVITLIIVKVVRNKNK